MQKISAEGARGSFASMTPNEQRKLYQAACKALASEVQPSCLQDREITPQKATELLACFLSQTKGEEAAALHWQKVYAIGDLLTFATNPVVQREIARRFSAIQGTFLQEDLLQVLQKLPHLTATNILEHLPLVFPIFYPECCVLPDFLTANLYLCVQKAASETQKRTLLEGASLGCLFALIDTDIKDSVAAILQRRLQKGGEVWKGILASASIPRRCSSLQFAMRCREHLRSQFSWEERKELFSCKEPLAIDLVHGILPPITKQEAWEEGMALLRKKEDFACMQGVIQRGSPSEKALLFSVIASFPRKEQKKLCSLLWKSSVEDGKKLLSFLCAQDPTLSPYALFSALPSRVFQEPIGNYDVAAWNRLVRMVFVEDSSSPIVVQAEKESREWRAQVQALSKDAFFVEYLEMIGFSVEEEDPCSFMEYRTKIDLLSRNLQRVLESKAQILCPLLDSEPEYRQFLCDTLSQDDILHPILLSSLGEQIGYCLLQKSIHAFSGNGIVLPGKLAVLLEQNYVDKSVGYHECADIIDKLLENTTGSKRENVLSFYEFIMELDADRVQKLFKEVCFDGITPEVEKWINAGFLHKVQNMDAEEGIFAFMQETFLTHLFWKELHPGCLYTKKEHWINGLNDQTVSFLQKETPHLYSVLQQTGCFIKEDIDPFALLLFMQEYVLGLAASLLHMPKDGRRESFPDLYKKIEDALPKALKQKSSSLLLECPKNQDVWSCFFSFLYGEEALQQRFWEKFSSLSFFQQHQVTRAFLQDLGSSLQKSYACLEKPYYRRGIEIAYLLRNVQDLLFFYQELPIEHRPDLMALLDKAQQSMEQ